MSKEFLKAGERVYCTGAYLIVGEHGGLEIDEIDGESFCDGLPVQYDDDTNQFYNEEEEITHENDMPSKP